MEGETPSGLVAGAATTVRGSVYLFGGFNGEAQDELYRVTLPSDFCHAISAKDKCTSTPGCSWCQVYKQSGNTSQPTNQSACYSVLLQVPQVCHAQVNVTHVEFVNGTQCHVSVAASRACDTYYSCSACLKKHPGAHGASAKCKWCVNCRSGGKCVNTGDNCDAVHPCSNTKQMSLKTSQKCIENGCEAASCSSCKSNNLCLWTPKLHWTTEALRTLRATGYFPWSCFQKAPVSNETLAISSPPDACPVSCTHYTDCGTCLNAKGMLSCPA